MLFNKVQFDTEVMAVEVYSNLLFIYFPGSEMV